MYHNRIDDVGTPVCLTVRLHSHHGLGIPSRSVGPGAILRSTGAALEALHNLFVQIGFSFLLSILLSLPILHLALAIYFSHGRLCST
jgi:hypothetical protein